MYANKLKKAARISLCMIMATGIFLNLAVPAIAQDAEPANIKPSLNIDIPTIEFSDIATRGDYIDVPWIAEYFSGAYKYAIGIGGFLAAIMMMIGGFMYLTSGDSSRSAKGKGYITDAVLGLAVLLGSYVILNAVNPDLTTLNALRIKRAEQTLFVANETPSEDVEQGSGTPTQPGKVPYIGQWKYDSVPYLDKDGKCTVNPKNGKSYTIASSGCAIASAAMAISHLTGDSASGLVPKLAEASSENGHRVCNSKCDCMGTAVAFFHDDKILGQYGVKGQSAGDKNSIINLLKDGVPVIMLQKAGLFTGGGHYIVLAGINEDGTIIVNDPGRNPNKPYDCDKSKKPCPNLDQTIPANMVPQDWVFKNYTGSWYMTKK